MGDLKLRDLRIANLKRQREWDKAGGIDLSYRGNELAGEVGEACNIIKKLERERLGIRGSRATKEQLAEELADVLICVDLIAMASGIDLGAAVVAKFNATSEKVGLETRLQERPPEAALPAQMEELSARAERFLDEVLDLQVEEPFARGRLLAWLREFIRAIPVQHDDQVGGVPVERAR